MRPDCRKPRAWTITLPRAQLRERYFEAPGGADGVTEQNEANHAGPASKYSTAHAAKIIVTTTQYAMPHHAGTRISRRPDARARTHGAASVASDWARAAMRVGKSCVRESRSLFTTPSATESARGRGD